MGSGLAASVTAPYTDTIQSTTVGSDLANVVHATNANATWAVANSGGSNYYQFTDATGGGSTTADFTVSNLTAASQLSFTLTTTFTINSTSTSGNMYEGLVALGNSTTSGYLADVNGTSMRLINLGVDSGFTTVTGTFSGINLTSTSNSSTVYTETLSGVYSGSTLTLSFTLSDGTHSTTISGATTTFPTTAAYDYFGIRDNNANTTTAMGVQYDSLSLSAMAVPEPSTWLLLFLGAGMIGAAALRRKRVEA